MLVAAIVLVFLVLLALSVAAPKIARGLEREREVEAKHRAQQYVRAIRVFYRKNNNRYPGSIEQLKMTNNQRFLRQEYLDPMTGKNDWRIIRVGENKTKVKGLFNEDLPGLPAGGLGGSSINGPQTTGAPGFGGNNLTGAPGFGGNNLTGAPANGQAAPATGTTGTSTTDATQATGGGPIMGIGSSKSGDAIIVVNEKDRFEDWEFLYDPRIEQLYAKGQLNGGGINSGPATSAFPPIGGQPAGGPGTPAPPH